MVLSKILEQFIHLSEDEYKDFCFLIYSVYSKYI